MIAKPSTGLSGLSTEPTGLPSGPSTTPSNIIRASLLISVVALLGSTGCDWREFSDLSDSTWVNVTKSPGDTDFTRYGEAIAIASQDDGVRFFAWGQTSDGNDGLAQVTYSASGSPSTSGLMFESNAADSVASDSVLPMARDSSSEHVVVGLSENGGLGGRVLVWSPGSAAPQQGLVHPFDGPVNALIAGLITDNATVPELVVIHGTSLELVPNYQTSADPVANVHKECTPSPSSNAPFNLAVSGSTILVAFRPDGSGEATLSFVDADKIANTMACGVAPLAPVSAPNNERDFGSSLLVTDLIGNTTRDFVAGAPSSNKVYVINGQTGVVETTIDAPSGAGNFGTSLAMATYGDPVLIIGAPNSAVDGEDNAGAVYLYTESDGEFTLAATLHDANPVADQHFGQAVSVSSFNGQDIIIVGAEGEIFTYFLNPLNNETDPRDQ